MRSLTNVSVIVSGLLFGLGLSLSGMTNPDNVLGFLDVFGDWNPALMFVLGGAVITNFFGTRWCLSRKQPLFDSVFHLPNNQQIDFPLVLGAILFGIGWGLTGYCPGASLAALSYYLSLTTMVFVISMIFGMWLANHVKERFKNPN